MCASFFCSVSMCSSLRWCFILSMPILPNGFLEMCTLKSPLDASCWPAISAWTTLIVPFLVKRRSGEVLFNILPRYCDVEELWQFFPKNYFHVVFVSNALDHTVHPIRGLKLLLWVLHPDGKLLLRHFRQTLLPFPIFPYFTVCRFVSCMLFLLRRIAGMYIQNDGCRCLMGSISGASM